MLDKLKITAALLVVAASVGLFYYFPEQSTLLRSIGILLAVIIAAAIVFTTAQGKAAWEFGVGARTEVRKVVWPTQKETTQTTLIVLLMVVLVGVAIWLFDALTFWVVYDLILEAVQS